MKMKMKYGSHRYDINRPRPGHGHNYTKQKIFNTFISKNRLILAKNQATAKSYSLRLNFCCLKIICSLHPRLSFKSNRIYS